MTVQYRWPDKDPDATLDYQADWSQWLTGETITSVVWIVPAGLTKAAESNTGTTATIWLAGGALNQTPIVVWRVTTTGGRTDDRSILLPIRNR